MDFFTYFCSMEERKYIVYIHKNKINGEFVKEYKSISEANMEFGINKKSSAISRACKEERKTAYGFIWKFKEKEVMYGT